MTLPILDYERKKFCLVISLGLLPERGKFPCCEAVLGRGPFEKSMGSADSHQWELRYRFSYSQLNLWMRPKSQLTWRINCNLMRNFESEASSTNLTGFCIYRNNDLIHAPNSPKYASTVHEPRTSRCSCWIRKGRGIRDQIANICWIIEEAREFQKSIYLCFIDYAKAFDYVNQNKLENS